MRVTNVSVEIASSPLPINRQIPTVRRAPSYALQTWTGIKIPLHSASVLGLPALYEHPVYRHGRRGSERTRFGKLAVHRRPRFAGAHVATSKSEMRDRVVRHCPPEKGALLWARRKPVWQELRVNYSEAAYLTLDLGDILKTSLPFRTRTLKPHISSSRPFMATRIPVNLLAGRFFSM